ncbi:hypothetical protein D3C78_1444310 [compost metagenome]
MPLVEALPLVVLLVPSPLLLCPLWPLVLAPMPLSTERELSLPSPSLSPVSKPRRAWASLPAWALRRYTTCRLLGLFWALSSL